MLKRIPTEEEKEAARVRSRAWNKANKLKSPEEIAAWKERRRAQNRKDRAAIKADPDRYAARLERERERSRQQRASNPDTRTPKELAAWRSLRREQERKRTAEIKADPERYAAFLERQRQEGRRRYAADPAKVKAWNDASVARRKEKVAAYKKGWNEQNAERVAAKKAEKYRNNLEENREDHRNRYRKDAERRKAKVRDYFRKNKDSIRRKSAEHYKKNKAKFAARMRKFYATHPGYASEATMRRRAIEKGATIGDPKEIKAYYQRIRTDEVVVCHYCKQPIPKGERTVDHAKPLIRGGAHAVENLVPACKSCNCSKGDKTPEEFAAVLAGQ